MPKMTFQIADFEPTKTQEAYADWLINHFGIGDGISPIVRKALFQAMALGGSVTETAARKRLEDYIPKRPADEPHEPGCQITRLGPKHCCTCESNSVRRREGVAAAGRANDTDVLAGLGSMEQYAWHEARHAADPQHSNPYNMRGRTR